MIDYLPVRDWLKSLPPPLPERMPCVVCGRKTEQVALRVEPSASWTVSGYCREHVGKVPGLSRHTWTVMFIDEG